MKKGIYKDCEICGKLLYSKPSENKRFCSRSCCSKGKRPKPKTGKFFNCINCRKSVWVRKNAFNRKLHFCNKKCQIEYSKKTAYRDNCIVCGKIYYCQPCQKVMRNRKTCSRKCFGKLRSILALENRIKNGFTKHQIDRCIRYSADSDNWRKQVFKKDDYTCQECKIRGGCLEAHH